MSYARVSALVLFVGLIQVGCASRQITEDNNLPQTIMDSRVELNAELIGKPKTDASTVIFYVDASPARSQAGSFGNGGLRFNYMFDSSVQLTVDGKTTVLTPTKTSANHIEIDQVPKSLVKSMANAQSVTVKTSADHGRIPFSSEFSKKNFIKFQEFVQKYIDANQNVNRGSFIERLFQKDDD